MAGRKTKSTKRAPQQAKKYLFEPGERSMPLPAKVATIEVSEDGTGVYSLPPPPPGPDHLRVLGWGYSITPSKTEDKFMSGTGFSRKAARAVTGPKVPSQDEMPSVTVVGAPDETVTVMVIGQMWYKPAEV